MEIAALAVSLAAVVVAISSTLFERRQRILELSLLREQMARGRTANVSLTQEDTYREYGYFVWEFTVANTGLAAAEDVELQLLTERGDEFSLVGARHRGALLPGERAALKLREPYESIQYKAPKNARVSWSDAEGEHSVEKRLLPALPDLTEPERSPNPQPY